MGNNLSIILPAKNESASLLTLLPKLTELYKDAEIIVVNDGSKDNSIEICNKFNVKVINHPYPKGNGASIKSGARAASNEILVFMDADGQHNPEDIKTLQEKISKGYDMVVGARSKKAHASFARYIANLFYNYLASWVTGHTIHDLTSGFRAIEKNKFLKYLYLLPNGFSYPTTITMAFFRAGYSVNYVPVNVYKRMGESHIRPLYDGLRFLLIIFKVGTLYAPFKIFVPISALFFLAGIGNYLYTYIAYSRFTNMSLLLLVTSILVFIIGLISEQLTTLMYQNEK